MAYALQCTLPGTPVLRYGEEIGMGDDLSLPERYALRTPMQWSGGAGGGFSDAKLRALVRPLVASGEFEKLYKKWFESPIPPKGINLQAPMSQELKDNMKALSDKPAT